MMRVPALLLVGALVLPNALMAQDPISKLLPDLTYRMVGPSRGGRVTAVAGHADHRGTFYMGATGGGVWKTTDYGQVWRNVSDGYFQTGSVGAIRVADSDPNVVYVGTGSDGIRSNVIAGRGVYRSSDAGKTWAFVGLRNVGQIGAVLIHPNDPNIVYVAAIGHAFGPSQERGVYRSLDAGRHWDRVLFLSDSTGAVDLEFAPDNPREIYAAMWRAERKPWTIISGAREGGIYKSSDGGDTWRHLTTGLPSGLVGKSDLAVSADDPNRLYVLMEADPGGGLYRSDNRGERFHLINTQRGILNRPFYYTNVDADPSDADVVYINNEGFFKSENGGQSFERRSTPHGDNHDMWINPNDPSLFIQSNDGGANVTLNGGVTWSPQSNQPTAELYQVDVDDQLPYWLYAGQQDNSTIAVPSLPPYPATRGGTSHWLSIGGCETGPAVPKPGNADIVYANCKGRFGRYSKQTGQEKQYYVGAANMYGHNPRDLRYRFQRVSPIEVSPHDPNVVYHASQFLHITRDEGVTWETISPDLTAFEPDKQVISGGPINRDITGEEFYSTIYAVEESPLEPGLIWVGANDGPIHVTRDGGTTWDNVTPADLPPNGRVQHIDPSPHRPGKAYAAVYRYLLGDWQPYIYRTTDYGKSWTRLTTGANGIPNDYPTRVVREDPDREGLLYAGTEFGLFISFDDGASWQSFQQNLPVTPVTDLKVYRKDLVISTMGRSFWIMDNLTPLHQLTQAVTSRPFALFTPRDAHRLRYSAASRSPADPQYPPPGAAIDYYVAQEPVGGLTLEILGSAGEILRVFTSEPRLEQPTEGQDMRGPPARTRRSTRLATSPGVHRIVWDLRAEGPIDPRTQRASGTGPIVPPGQYEVRLSAGDWVERVGPLTVLIDPRTATDGVSQADLVEQYALGIEVRDAITDARDARHRLSMLKERAPRAGSRMVRQLEQLEAQLTTRQDISYPQPMLENQLEYLSSMINRADQRIGNDAKMRYQELRADLDRIRAAIRELATQIGD